MAEYKFQAGGLTRASDGASIPSDPLNMDYLRACQWVASGGIPDPADNKQAQAVPTVPAMQAVAAKLAQDNVALATQADVVASALAAPTTG